MSEPEQASPVVKVAAASAEEAAAWRRQYRLPALRSFPSLALRARRADIVAYYYNKGVLFKSDFIDAARRDDTITLRTLLSAGANPDEPFGSNCAINRAAEARAHKALQLLIDNGARIDQIGRYGETPLMWAAYNDDLTAADILMKAGADPAIAKIGGAYSGLEAWSLAFTRGHKRTAKILLDYRSSRADKSAPLALAGPKEVLRLPPPEPQCPPGWSVVDKNDVAMAVQTIEDDKSRLSIRNVFDFAGKRLLTEFKSANGAPLLSEKRFDELDPQLVEKARRVFTEARKKAGQETPPGLI